MREWVATEGGNPESNPLYLMRGHPHIWRPTDIMVSRADPSKADRLLGWKAQFAMPDVARMMVEARLEAMRAAPK